MDYLLLKTVHMSCAALSGLGFAWRGVLRWRASPWLAQRWLRVLPHLVDSVLLASAVGLMLWSRQYPFVDGWLTAKFFALLAYIGCGSLAMRGRGWRAGLAYLLALLLFSYLVSVAWRHHAGGWPGWLLGV